MNEGFAEEVTLTYTWMNNNYDYVKGRFAGRGEGFRERNTGMV